MNAVEGLDKLSLLVAPVDVSNRTGIVLFYIPEGIRILFKKFSVSYTLLMKAKLTDKY